MEAIPGIRKSVKLAASVFLAWHVIGITLVGPFSQSEFHNQLMKVYGGYLALFHLDRNWPFYAPNPYLGSILTYQTSTADGETQIYPLSQKQGKMQHAYFRYTNFSAYMFLDPEYSKKRHYDLSLARYLCRLHKDQQVLQIQFNLETQQTFTAQDYLAGKHALDPEFLHSQTFGPYSCHGAQS